jgi:GNAT superfamily N-acetyltransferase
VITPLGATRTKEVVALLADAFADDPGFVYALPDGARRRAQLARLFAGAVDVVARRGELGGIVVDGAVVAVATWLAPGVAASLWDLVRAGIFALPFRVGMRESGRIVRCLAAVERMKPAVVRAPSWSLEQLAVAPSQKGRGLGRALLLGGIDERLARRRAPVALVTSSPRNLPFYRAAGFEIVDEQRVGTPGDGFRLWGLVREPR